MKCLGIYLKNMIRIAFVHTEYQQNILFALCLQEKIIIDYLIIRENTLLNKDVSKYVKKVIYYNYHTYTLKNINDYYIDFIKKNISPIVIKQDIIFYTWTLLHPLVRLSIQESNSYKINIFEDGSGSYIKWGKLNYTNLKSTFLLFIIASILSKKIRILREKKIISWSFFNNSYPDNNYINKKISPPSFEEVLLKSIKSHKVIELEDNSIVFITSPYVEDRILTTSQYIESFTKSIEKIMIDSATKRKHIYLKLHPRNHKTKEKERVLEVEKLLKIEIEILEDDSNIELIAIQNKTKQIKYYSIGSTALYILKILTLSRNSTILIKDENLLRNFDFQRQLVKVYKKIGIKTI